MFIELQRGRSFKGIAKYCLHDPDRAITSDRVDFVEIQNLSTDNPEVAWRLMAAKHYAQNELKRQAGVGLGGRKDGKPVGHLLISWGRDEAEAQELDRQEMLTSARGALRSIGAEEYPSMIIAHTDTEHPHCHVICCFIGDDGRLKKNWKEKEKLSRFALEREIAIHGEPVVKLRERNWKQREAGEKTESKKKQARHLYKLEKAAEQDEGIREFAEDHKAKLIEHLRKSQGEWDKEGNLVREGAKQRHIRHQQRLHWCHKERLRRLKELSDKQATLQERQLRRENEPTWDNLLARQEAERKEFRYRESTLLGRAHNLLRYTDWKSVLARSKANPSPPFSRAFNLLSQTGHRQEYLAKRQQLEQESLRDEQHQRALIAREQILQERLLQEELIRQKYGNKCEVMRLRQEATSQSLKQVQQQLTRERNQELKAYREREKAAKVERAQQQLVQENSTNSIELTPIANRVFTPSIVDEHSQGSSDETRKPKRTRRRKNPSEKTNRRHTRPTEQNDTKLINSTEKERPEQAERFSREHEHDDHER